MQVAITKNPKRTTGFRLEFPWSQAGVDLIKMPLGTTWNKPSGTWETDGPEVLLDFQRFGIGVFNLTPEARAIAEHFRQEIWDAMDARVMDVEDETFGYQRQGSHWLASMSAAVLGDDMGTGKTKQALDAAALVNPLPRILIICPKTLCYNWMAEIQKWHPEWEAGVVPDNREDTRRRGELKIGRRTFWRNPPQIVITNYEKLNLTGWPFDHDFQIVIPDEATNLKNWKTARYKNVKQIVQHLFRRWPNENHFWPLTGTPLEIKLEELYSILHLARPAVVGNFYRFRDQHMQTDMAGNIIGVQNLELLRERIAPFILRRTKREVLPFLPGKVYTNAYVTLSEPEREAYSAFTAQFHNWLTERGVSGGGDPLVQSLRMRQFCCSPKLFTDELGTGSKFEMLEEILAQHTGRAVIFCFFDEVCQLLRQWLEPHARAFISGDVPAEERIRRVDAFNNGELGDIFISTDAGNAGINLVGADLIIHYDQLFNPQRMNQREDRLDRIGQTHQVNVMNILCLDTIEVGMYQLNREREHLFREVVDGAEEAILRRLDAPRWRRLIEGRLNNEDLNLAAQAFVSAAT